MSIKHVQAELQPHEFEAFRKALEESGLSVKEGAREAIMAWVRQRRWRDDPIFGIVGIAGKRGGRHAARDVDEIYDED